uniref:Uncharacterized protein n=1 Tax=Parascaris equorum TaxID=6256 RepID=A0A914RQY4_PAREQ
MKEIVIVKYGCVDETLRIDVPFKHFHLKFCSLEMPHMNLGGRNHQLIRDYEKNRYARSTATSDKQFCEKWALFHSLFALYTSLQCKLYHFSTFRLFSLPRPKTRRIMLTLIKAGQLIKVANNH